MEPLFDPIGAPLRRILGPKRNSPPYRIVFVSPCWHRGGLEAVTITHLCQLNRDLFEPWIMTGDVMDMDDSVPEGVELVADKAAFEFQFPPSPATFMRARQVATPILRDIDADVVIGQLVHAPLFAANDLSAPVIIEYHHCGWSWDAQEHPSDAIIAVSQDTARRVHSNGRIPQVPCYLIYNGINASLFRPHTQEAREAVRHWCGFRPDDLVVGFSGRISTEKDPVAWVSAFANIKRFREPRARGLIVGPIWDAEVYQATRERAAKRELTWGTLVSVDEIQQYGVRPDPLAEVAQADIVHVHVAYEQMPQMYAAMDCLMHTRKDEPFGLIIPEALMCQTPVVACIGGGIPEIYDLLGSPPYVDLCDPGDLDEMADAVVAHLHDGRVPEAAALDVGSADMFGSERMTRQFEEVVMQYLDQRQTKAEVEALEAEA